MICFILIAFSSAPTAKAAAVDDAVDIFKDCHVYSCDMESIKDNHIIVNWKYQNNYTTDSANGNYANPFIDIEGFEIQIRIIRLIKLLLIKQRIMLKMSKVRNIPIKSLYLFSEKMVVNYMPEYVHMEKSKQSKESNL